MTLTATTSNNTSIATIPFHGTNVQSVEIDGKPQIVFKPLVESIGMDYSSQIKKLKGKSWATMGIIPTVGSDGKNREMTMIDLRTLTMWLATIDENRISPEARPLVVAYQSEVADAIEAYWAKGGAINPRAGMDAETLIEKFNLPRNYGEALRELADTNDKVEELTVENLALKGGDGIRIKDFIKTYFVAPNERAFFEWFYFRGYLIDGRIYDESGKPARLNNGPKLRWDHAHPTYIGRKYFKLVPTGSNKYGGKQARVIPERALDLVAVLINAKDLATQMTQQGQEALDEYRAPGQLRIIHGGAAS